MQNSILKVHTLNGGCDEKKLTNQSRKQDVQFVKMYNLTVKVHTQQDM